MTARYYISSDALFSPSRARETLKEKSPDRRNFERDDQKTSETNQPNDTDSQKRQEEAGKHTRALPVEIFCPSPKHTSSSIMIISSRRRRINMRSLFSGCFSARRV